MTIAKHLAIRTLRRFGYQITRIAPEPVRDDLLVSIIDQVSPYTMTSPERISAMWEATRYVVKHEIPGAIVECGVWRGGSMMVSALALLHDQQRRDLFLFDTFEGMPAAGERDKDLKGRSPSSWIRNIETTTGVPWLSVGLDDVRHNMDSTGYAPDAIHYVRGLVEETIPREAPDEIALLRLDTDWYGSTKHELEYLVPRMSHNSVLIVDDYGHWDGARQAVDEYFSLDDRPTLLCPIDYSCRLAIIG